MNLKIKFLLNKFQLILRTGYKKRVKELEDGVQIIKQVPSHPRDKFKRTVAALSDELEFIKQVPEHPQDRLRRRQNLSEVQFIKQQPGHPRDRLQRKAKERKVKMQANDDNVQITKYAPSDIEFMK